MGDITMSKKELEQLQKGIKNRYIKNNGTQTVKWNSTIANYEGLSKDIFTDSEQVLSSRFLQTVFYESLKKDEYTARAKNVELLYQYAFRCSRELYLKSNGKRQLHVAAKESINASETAKEWLDVELINMYDLRILLDEGVFVELHLDKHFFSNYNAVNLLRDLFITIGFEIFNVFAFYNLNFSMRDSEYATISNWEKEFVDSQGVDDINALISILHKINKNQKFKMFDDMRSMYHYNLHRKDKKDEKEAKVGHLEDAYLETVNSEEKARFLFLCVISFNQFFDDKKDEVKMLRHFSLFNKSIKSSLKEHYVNRIFTLACRKNEKGELVSSYVRDLSNVLLYQYLIINKESGCDTFLMLYDENQIEEVRNDLFLKQDYVLRIKDEVNVNKASDIYYNLSNSMIYGSHKDGDDNKLNRLYLALPEDQTGRNKLIMDDNINNIIRCFEEFQERMRIFLHRPDNDVVTVFKVNGKQDGPILDLDITKKDSKLRKILRINQHNEQEFINAKERALEFYKNIEPQFIPN